MRITYKLLNEIASEYGPSFYLLDSNRFQENFHLLIEAYRGYYKNTNIAYSYKTNYIPRFCEIVNGLGGYAEVVSSMEMILALKLGILPEKIFFNGPFKEIEYVEKLLKMGGTVNVDAIEELYQISEIADNHDGKALRLGIRCNFDINNNTISRFGFDVESEVFLDAIKIIDSHEKLKLVGLHCHYPNRQIESWRFRTLGMIKVIDQFFKHRIKDLEHISLGGGIFGNMTENLKSQFPYEIPTFKEYATESAKVMEQYFSKNHGSNRPQLIIEPGTALVADALQYACTVNSIKGVRGKTIVTLSGSSYNMNPNPNRKNVPIKCFSGDSATNALDVEDANFAGYTCIESDFLYKGFSGKISNGDYVVFEDVGSYSIVMKPPFILPNVAIVEPTLDCNNYSLIKRKETFNDIFRTYFFDDASML